MRKSNNYYKFMEYVSYGKRYDNTICNDIGVLECTSYCTVSDIEYYENTTLGVENDWLTIKNVLVNEEVIYVYYVKGERTFYIEQFFLDDFKTQKDLKYAIHKAVDKFFINNVGILKDKETSEIEDENKHKEISDVENVCGDCSHFNACMQGYQTIAPSCCMFDSLHKARKNPEWHHVRLSTLANIDFDMLDKKRQTYLTAYRDLKQTLSYLRKCKTQDTYDTCFIRYTRRKNMLWADGKISDAMRKYIERKLSMQNVESGVWASRCEDSTGHHESRRYNKSRA